MLKNKPKIVNSKHISNEFKIGFISGFIDAEGHIDKKKGFVEVVNTKRKVMMLIKKYLKELGIDSSIKIKKKSWKSKKRTYRIYISLRFIEINNISLKVKNQNKN